MNRQKPMRFFFSIMLLLMAIAPIGRASITTAECKFEAPCWKLFLYSKNPDYVQIYIDTREFPTSSAIEVRDIEIICYDKHNSTSRHTATSANFGSQFGALLSGNVYRGFFQHGCRSPKLVKGGRMNYEWHTLGGGKVPVPPSATQRGEIEATEGQLQFRLEAVKPTMHATGFYDGKHQICFSHQLDFLVGDWSVNAGMEVLGDSRIERSKDGCIVTEDYIQYDGAYTRRTIFFFDNASHRWLQTWADSLGNTGNSIGQFLDESPRFEGKTRLPSQSTALDRITFLKIGPDELNRDLERSTNGGKTWNIPLELTYYRKANH